MSALLPSEAVTLLYRRYLKAANRIPNVTIRMLLLQQIRSGFRRNKGITNPSAQRELISQAHKDLQVLEDERLSRTLYINRLGLVSCLDWEVRRTEYNFTPQTQYFIAALVFTGFLFLVLLVMNAESVEVRHPEINAMVGAMAMRLEADSPEELNALRERQVRAGLERQEHQLTLEQRVLATFHEAPNVKLMPPSLRNPTGVVHYEE
ncbi:Complex 1 LYR protein [Trypanosoma melophagium]|uniref:Complex 1 LYR protein n=1 Tax=Trypanosoma melophagium TaxID=715481 RepID=UPI003519D9C2|nr:Complex 1 LYR protein [Trypanosoma melophagium]